MVALQTVNVSLTYVLVDGLLKVGEELVYVSLRQQHTGCSSHTNNLEEWKVRECVYNVSDARLPWDFCCTALHYLWDSINV